MDGVSVDVRYRTDRPCRTGARFFKRLVDTTLPSDPKKHALPLEIKKVMPSYHVRGRSGLRAPVQDSTRIQGGNWKMPGIQSAGHVHDDGECQMSIAEFMADHGLLNDIGSG